MLFTTELTYAEKVKDNLEYRDSEIKSLEAQLSAMLYNLFVISNKLDILEEVSKFKNSKNIVNL